MNNFILYDHSYATRKHYVHYAQPGELNGLFDKVKAAVKKVTSTAKDVVQDSAKLAANAATTGIRTIAGKDPLYSGSDFDTKFGTTMSKVQSATSKASLVVAATVGATQLIPKLDQQQQVEVPPLQDQQSTTTDLQASGPSTSNLLLVGAGVVALGALVYFTSTSN